LSILGNVLGTRWPSTPTRTTLYIPVNQPGVGQEKTTYDEDEEADDFVLHQMEEEREAPLLHHKFYNDVMSSPLSRMTEEERQQARDFHSKVGFIAV
jgi:hypothetical protein